MVAELLSCDHVIVYTMTWCLSIQQIVEEHTDTVLDMKDIGNFMNIILLVALCEFV